MHLAVSRGGYLRGVHNEEGAWLLVLIALRLQRYSSWLSLWCTFVDYHAARLLADHVLLTVPSFFQRFRDVRPRGGLAHHTGKRSLLLLLLCHGSRAIDKESQCDGSGHLR